MSGHQVVRTRSGALAMRSLAAGEVMHPGVGPLIEAEHLYVRQSHLADRLLLQGTNNDQGAPVTATARSLSPTRSPPPLVLFDIGMGAGTNAAAAIAASETAPPSAAHLIVVSFERDLDALGTALREAPAAFGWGGAAAAEDWPRALLRAGHHQTARTTWHLEHGDVLDALSRQGARRADIVFWDPFSPAVNPGLWTVAAFAAMRAAAGPRCTLFTYSASTAVRVAMVLGGWMVGVGDAIGAKTATTVAAMDVHDLARPLDRRWLARLSRIGVPLPADAPDAVEVATRVAAAPQFSLRTLKLSPAPGGTAPARDSR